ncbi:MAG: hypothetical protein GY866_08470 [Proteobacteria bacterium]|nr:hypothetical protein [Pseudomonadota bacterium]
MNNLVFRFLFRFDGIVNEKHIRQALDITNQHEIEQLSELLRTDERFVACSNSSWKCASLENIIEDKPIKDVIFVITDIETTGSIKGKDRIIDIAALKVRNGKVLGKFDSLVNPQKRISKPIVRLTKISNSTIEDSPIIEDVLPDYLRFSKDGIFVAHNSLFDFSFINTELKRINIKEFNPQVEICTFRIARKLLPHVKARGINGLSAYFDYQMENRHRAMPDVMATKFFLDRFLEQMEENNIATLHKLIEYQRDRLGKKELQKSIKRLRKKHVRLKIMTAEVPN